MRGLDRRDHRLAAAAWQVHVEQDDVGDAFGDQRDRRFHVLRLADDLDLVAELGPDPGTEHAMIVNEEDPRLAAGRGTLARGTLAGSTGARGTGTRRGHARLGWRVPVARGIVSDTSVPSPRTLRIAAEPPRRAILARTDSASPFLSSGTAAGSKPCPRSRTNTDTRAGSTSANSET